MDSIKLLMVDDNPDDCELYGRIFRHAGRQFAFHAVHSADEAFDLLAGGEQFDCVLLDYTLAQTTGMDLLHRLHQHFGGLPSAFIMLTGVSGERHVVEAMQAGVFDYLTKSECTPEDLLHAVKKASKLTHVRRQLAMQNAWRIQAEEDLRQAQLHSAELAGVRRAVATYLHEINSPLAGVMGYIDLLLGENHAPELNAAFGEMRSACLQIKHVLQSMEQLEELRSRPGTGNRGPLDLHQPVLGPQERAAQA